VTWPARGGVVIALSCLLCAAIVIQGPSPHDAEAGPPRVAVPPHPAQRPQPASAVAARLDARIAAPWPRLQEPDGRFRDILGGRHGLRGRLLLLRLRHLRPIVYPNARARATILAFLGP